MNHYVYYNPNPKGKNVGDCTIRAICKATGQDWENVYTELYAQGCALSDMPSADHVWGSYLRWRGYKRYFTPDQDIYTVDDFCIDNPVGTYLLKLPGHVVCVVDGHYYDTWDSGGEIPLYYWAR